MHTSSATKPGASERAFVDSGRTQSCLRMGTKQLGSGGSFRRRLERLSKRSIFTFTICAGSSQADSSSHQPIYTTCKCSWGMRTLRLQAAICRVRRRDWRERLRGWKGAPRLTPVTHRRWECLRRTSLELPGWSTKTR